MLWYCAVASVAKNGTIVNAIAMVLVLIFILLFFCYERPVE